MSDENATETADVVNKTSPDFVRVRTFVAKPGTGLCEDIEAGLIKECTDKEKLMELKKFIESIGSADGELRSDHVINLLSTVNGNMKTGKEKMLGVIEAFEKLDVDEQRRFQLARRLGAFGAGRGEIDSLMNRLGTEEEFEGFLRTILRQYI